MNFLGLVISVATFLLIGIFHPIVIQCEYYFTDKIWPVFFVLGIISICFSLRMSSIVASALLGALGCSFLWSILELKEQRQRVEKGWFPENPNRKK
jgi:dolichyl-phosphate-mannose--protein O-mannosyl transferase